MPCTERPVLSADCSALNTYRPAPDSDCSAFVALRFAPFADCSVIRIAPLHDSLCALDTWHFALTPSRSAIRIAPLHDSLRAQHLPLRILSDCSASQLAPCSILRVRPARGLLRARRFAPCAVHGLLRVHRFELRTVQELLPARHLTLRVFSDCSASQLAPCSTLNAPTRSRLAP